MSEKFKPSAFRNIEISVTQPDTILWPIEETAAAQARLQKNLDCEYAVGISDEDTFDDVFAFPVKVVEIDAKNFRLRVTNHGYEEYGDVIRNFRFICLASSLEEVVEVLSENSCWPNCTNVEEILSKLDDPQSSSVSDGSSYPHTIFKSTSGQVVEDGDCAYLYEYFAGRAIGEVDYRTKEVILAFKNATDINEPVVKLLADKIYQQLDDNFVIAVVPPSKLARQGRSSAHLLAKLIHEKARNDGKNIQYEPDILFRERDVESAHSSGGSRSCERAMENVVVRHGDLVNGRDILVIDDITTSGSSIEGARTLLRSNGARAVCGLVIGKTVSSNAVNRDSMFYENDNPVRTGFIFDLDQTLFDTSKIQGYRTRRDWKKAIELAERMSPKPEIVELIQYLQDNGYPVSIVTRSIEKYSRVLADKLGIKNVIAYHDVKDHSDKKEGFMRAASLMGVYESCCVVVGDDENNTDLKPAKELGMTTVHAKWFVDTVDSAYAQFVYESLDDIDPADFVKTVSARTEKIIDSIVAESD